MGDIADMMLEGTLCSMCGCYLGSGDGFPVMCRDCKRDECKPKYKKVACPHCNIKVKEIGLHNHMKDRHGIT